MSRKVNPLTSTNFSDLAGINRQIGVLRENMDVKGLTFLVREIEIEIERLLVRQGKKESDHEVYDLRQYASVACAVLTRIDNQNYVSHMNKSSGHLDKIPLDMIDPIRRSSFRHARAHILYQKGENENCQVALQESINILLELLRETDNWSIYQFMGCAYIFHPSMFTGGKEGIQIFRPEMTIGPAEKAIIQRGIDLNNHATALFLRDHDWHDLPLVIAGKITAGWQLLHPGQNWTDLLIIYQHYDKNIQLYLSGQIKEVFHNLKSNPQTTWLNCCMLACIMIYNTKDVKTFVHIDETTIIKQGMDLAKKTTKLYIDTNGWQTLPMLLAVSLSAGWRKLHPDGK